MVSDDNKIKLKFERYLKMLTYLKIKQNTSK